MNVVMVNIFCYKMNQDFLFGKPTNKINKTNVFKKIITIRKKFAVKNELIIDVPDE